MKSTMRTCFVISPIGPEGSESRAAANEFLELLVQPALEKFDFAPPIRADTIANAILITSDVVRHVQESDLCIIDLTNSNPNVFYECGRRHETGRPFIQMIAKDSKDPIPFDLSGIATVTYDLSKPRAVRESVLKLQEFIANIVASGFQSTTTGASLASVAQGIERIERKLNQILLTDGSARPSSPSAGGSTLSDLEEILQSPHEAFITSLRRGDANSAVRHLTRIKSTLPYKEYISAAALLASTGHPTGFEVLDSELNEMLKSPQKNDGIMELLTFIVMAEKKYFENSGKTKDGVRHIENIFLRCASGTELTDVQKGVIANMVGMLAWVTDDSETTIKYTRVALELNPKEPAYYFNLCLVYDKEKMAAELSQTLKNLAALPGLDQSHIDYLRRHGVAYQPGA